jgi:hypothetical protein
MDPDVALENMREAMEKLKTIPVTTLAGKSYALDDDGALICTAIEAWEALDGWMSKGGFRPEDWKP